jgi:outer membrane protein assembly complex protein YaeT
LRLAPAVLALAAAIGCRSAGREAEEAKDAGELVFEGNRRISEGSLRSSLRQDLEQLQQRGFRKSDVDDVAFEVERVYRSRGYHFARVNYDYSPRRAVIRIEEGPRVLVRDLRYTGNATFTERELGELLKSRRTGLLKLQRQIYVAGEVATLAGAVEEYYLEHGYLEVRVQEPVTEFTADRRGAIVTVAVYEGPQYVLEQIRFPDLPILDSQKLSERFAGLIGSAYVPRLRFEVRSGVEEAYSDLGYPNARATVRESVEFTPTAGNRTRVVFDVTADPGVPVVIRDVLVKGNKRTKYQYVKSRIVLGEGERYNGSLVRRSFKRLFGTGVFKSVDLRLSEPVGEERGAELRDLIVEVVEGPTVEYFSEVGFGSYDLLRAKAGVRKRNLFGRGLTARAEALGSIRGAEATVGLTDPWFLRSEWTADLPLTFLYREEPAFTIREQKVGLRFSRPLLRNLNGGAVYRFSLSRVERFEIIDLSLEEPNLRIGAAGPFLEFDARNDFLDPTRGIRARVYGEVGQPALGSEIEFLHGGFSASHHLQLLEGTVLAAAFQTDWIVPTGDTRGIPIQERVFNGGENTVRSFAQSEVGAKDPSGKPLGGEVRNLVSLELRQRIAGEFSIAVFGDYGNVAFTDSKPLDDFRPAVGTGLRYALPIGPLRLDVGFNPDKREGEDLFVIHFAVGLPY